MPHITSKKPLDLTGGHNKQTSQMSKTHGNGFGIRDRAELDSKVYMDESQRLQQTQNKIVRLSSRESAGSCTYSRKSSKQHDNDAIRVENNSSKKNKRQLIS